MRFGTVRRRALILGGALALSLVAACEDQLTLENYEQVTVGMTLTQVEELLGAGVEQKSAEGFDITYGAGISSGGGTSSSPVKMYMWEDGAVRITVYFRDGAVVSKTQSGLN